MRLIARFAITGRDAELLELMGEEPLDNCPEVGCRPGETIRGQIESGRGIGLMELMGCSGLHNCADLKPQHDPAVQLRATIESGRGVGLMELMGFLHNCAESRCSPDHMRGNIESGRGIGRDAILNVLRLPATQVIEIYACTTFLQDRSFFVVHCISCER